MPLEAQDDNAESHIMMCSAHSHARQQQTSQQCLRVLLRLKGTDCCNTHNLSWQCINSQGLSAEKANSFDFPVHLHLVVCGWLAERPRTNGCSSKAAPVEESWVGERCFSCTVSHSSYVSPTLTFLSTGTSKQLQ